jgi:hypothetical protein
MPDYRRPRAEGPVCCKAWDEVDPQDVDRLWSTLHVLAHSRLAFTEAYVAELTDFTFDAVHNRCESAGSMAWIRPVHNWSKGKPPLNRGLTWQGKLTRGRR